MGRRHGSDLVLLWLWHTPAATAPIRPLAWESPNAVGAALEKTLDQNKIKYMKTGQLLHTVLRRLTFSCLLIHSSNCGHTQPPGTDDNLGKESVHKH